MTVRTNVSTKHCVVPIIKNLRFTLHILTLIFDVGTYIVQAVSIIDEGYKIYRHRQP